MGENNNSITNCYATGTVSGRNSTGGLVGYNNNSITNCYATGAASGAGSKGGLVGYNNNSGTISNSFWDTDTSERSIGVGTGVPRGVTAATTTELQAFTSTSASWDENNWDFGTNRQYPSLRSYEVVSSSQGHGFILCNQPTATHVQCPLASSLTLQIASVNFGTVLADTPTAISSQLVILGKNLSEDITLTATAPLTFEGDVLTTDLTPEDDGTLRRTISVTWTPTSNHIGVTDIIISGDELSEDITVAPTGGILFTPEDTNDNDLLEINNIEQLNLVRDGLDGDYELTRNLDFNDPNSYVSGAVNNNYRSNQNSSNQGWEPIGDDTDAFAGTFEGNGFTINNLYINRGAYLKEACLQ